jgi:hypothetical protein
MILAFLRQRSDKSRIRPDDEKSNWGKKQNNVKVRIMESSLPRHATVILKPIH